MPILNDIMDHEVIVPAICKGLEKGRLEGLKEGLKEGQQMGSQNILRRQLERRFGALPEWAFDEDAQNGHGVKLATERASELLSHLAARSRALCASKELLPGC